MRDAGKVQAIQKVTANLQVSGMLIISIKKKYISKHINLYGENVKPATLEPDFPAIRLSQAPIYCLTCK